MDPVSPMPTPNAHSETVSLVMDDHDISQRELAQKLGYSESYVSRVCSGQYSVPTVITQTLWRMTRDHRIADIALGYGEFEIIPAESATAIDVPPTVRTASAVCALARINSDMAMNTLTGEARRNHMSKLIGDAINSLLLLRRSVTTERTPMDMTA